MAAVAIKKRWPNKKHVGTITYEPLLDCIQIWYGCSLGISDDLISFWHESFLSLFLDIDGQSLRLRGSAIN